MKILKPCKVKAVDLDATLADDRVINTQDYHPETIGAPIHLMVERVKAWLAEGIEVVIFTARVHPRHGLTEVFQSERAIKDWSRKVFGMELQVTCMKDPMFGEIWDDKAVRVEKNTGRISTQADVVDPLTKNAPDQIGEFLG